MKPDKTLQAPQTLPSQYVPTAELRLHGTTPLPVSPSSSLARDSANLHRQQLQHTLLCLSLPDWR